MGEDFPYHNFLIDFLITQAGEQVAFFLNETFLI